jgi:hypothetical protein
MGTSSQIEFLDCAIIISCNTLGRSAIICSAQKGMAPIPSIHHNKEEKSAYISFI